eukprot:GILK01008015.1.p1 GENE.GILK01008015.1~~GILK01008015.1.p1  ORF type:complete len:347 (-),score=24.82 GILK01008015.1:52-1029(-)
MDADEDLVASVFGEEGTEYGVGEYVQVEVENSHDWELDTIFRILAVRSSFQTEIGTKRRKRARSQQDGCHYQVKLQTCWTGAEIMAYDPNAKPTDLYLGYTSECPVTRWENMSTILKRVVVISKERARVLLEHCEEGQTEKLPLKLYVLQGRFYQDLEHAEYNRLDDDCFPGLSCSYFLSAEYQFLMLLERVCLQMAGFASRLYKRDREKIVDLLYLDPLGICQALDILPDSATKAELQVFLSSDPYRVRVPRTLKILDVPLAFFQELLLTSVFSWVLRDKSVLAIESASVVCRRHHGGPDSLVDLRFRFSYTIRNEFGRLQAIE